MRKAVRRSAGAGVVPSVVPRDGAGVEREVNHLPSAGGQAGQQEEHDPTVQVTHLALPGFTMAKRTTNSTRRLFSRPAAVALVSRGFDELKPFDPSRSLAMPWATR